MMEIDVIERKRNSGKTTILLHYMEVTLSTIMVVRTENIAGRTAEKASNLGLHLPRDRFISVALALPHEQTANEILIDDFDCIMEQHPELAIRWLNIASKITVTE